MRVGFFRPARERERSEGILERAGRVLLLCVLALFPAKCLSQCCPPVITSQPQSQTVTQGVNATFTIAVSSGTFLTYQWRFNGNNLFAATNSSLTMTNSQAWQQGVYSVGVTNAAGSAISSNAALTVVVKPGFIVAWGEGGGGETITPLN